MLQGHFERVRMGEFRRAIPDMSITTKTAWGSIVGPGLVMAFTLIGDALLYVVLPVHAATFGVSLGWVGLLLSVNRFARVLLYGWIARLGHRFGPKRLMVTAAICATLSTLAYGLASDPIVLLFARVLWGLTFAAVNLCSLVYALSGAGKAGASVGLSRSLTAMGPSLALSLGAALVMWLGPRDVFVVLGLVTALAIPTALSLPRISVAESAKRDRGFGLPSPIDLYYCVIGLVIDGLFVFSLSILLAGRFSLEWAVLSSGLLLASRHLIVAVIAPIAGVLADRFGADRLQMLLGGLCACGLIGLGFDLALPSLLAIVMSRAALGTLGNVSVAQRERDNAMYALSRLGIWSDIGAAIGPVLAGFLIEVLSLSLLYHIGAALLLLAAIPLLLDYRRR